MRSIYSTALLCGLVVLLFITCKKESSSTGLPTAPALVGEAKAYFTGQVENTGVVNSRNYRAGIGKTVLWDQAEVADLSFGKAVIVPVKYAAPLFVKRSLDGRSRISLDGQTRLFVYQDGKKGWHADLVTSFPDSAYWTHPAAGFSGLRFVEDWQGNPLTKYRYGPGQAVKKYTPSEGDGNSEGNSHAGIAPAACEEIYGYNYAVGDEGNGEAWEEEGDCADGSYVIEIPGGGPTGVDYGVGGSGGGGGGGSTGTETLVIMSPHNVITDIKSYFQCFGIHAGSTYKVTICVNQPYPGTRESWALSPYNSASGYSNIIDAGHCFLIFSEQDGSTTITRNIGFYPDGMITPIFSSTQGVLNNDEQHEYNISGSFSVSSGSFFNMLAYVSRGNVPGYQYNLDNNNCTTFDINAFAAGGIHLPSTIGSWLGGSGNDPGDMGEDIRTGNISGMTKNIDEVAHPNTGTCN